jgi:hypothetical protein
MKYLDMNRFSSYIDDLSKELSIKLGKTIKRGDIFNALFLLLSDSRDLRWAGDLWNIEITESEIDELLENFDFSILDKTVLTDNQIFPFNVLIQRRAEIKENGMVWIIHKYDKDPFPSNPHAHCIDQNIKLDLSNGKYFRNKALLGKLSKKDLTSIREKANKYFNGLLPELNI